MPGTNDTQQGTKASRKALRRIEPRTRHHRAVHRAAIRGRRGTGRPRGGGCARRCQNAVRHSNATALKITVSVEDELSVKVVDDGHGLPAAIAGSGVINLRLRAEQVGGTFSIESPTTGRTVLT